jgi:hypothetical protein
MTDQEYFNQYKQAFETVFSSRTEDLVYLEDAELRYQTMTDSMLDLLGANSLDQVRDHTPKEIALNVQGIPEPDAEQLEQFNKANMQVKKTLKRGVFLEVFPYHGANHIFAVHKTPLVNPDTGNFVGVRGEINPLVWPNVIKTLFKMHGAKGLLLGHKTGNHNPLKDYPLTNIQHMVLFLCLNNYSYSEIALLLNEFGHEITPIRVNDYLEQLKLIFHVRNKTQLIEKAIGLNFHVYLPEGLFNKLSSIDISNEVASIVCCNCQLGTCTVHQPEHTVN